jgi:hypothetical protein
MRLASTSSGNAAHANSLIRRIQELEGFRQNNALERAQLGTELAASEEKIKKLNAENRKLREQGSPGITATSSITLQRQAQSMEARKKVAENAAKQAVADKKEVQRENKRLKQQLAASKKAAIDAGGVAGSGNDDSGDAGIAASGRNGKAAAQLEKMAEKIAQLEHEKSSAVQKLEAEKKTGAVLIKQNELRMNALTLELTRIREGALASTGANVAKNTKSAQEKQIAEQNENHLLKEAKLAAEGRAKAAIAYASEADARVAELEAKHAELEVTHESLRGDHAGLGKDLEAARSAAARVISVQEMTRESMTLETQERVGGLLANGNGMRAEVECDMSTMVDGAVAAVEQQFQRTFGELGLSWARSVEDAEAQMARVKADTVAQYQVEHDMLKETVETEVAANLQLENQRAGLKRAKESAERALAIRNRQYEQALADSISATKRGNETESHLALEQAKREAEVGWTELVDILREQAEDALQAATVAKRATVETQTQLVDLRMQYTKLQAEKAGGMSTGSAEAQLTSTNTDNQRLLAQLEAVQADAREQTSRAARQIDNLEREHARLTKMLTSGNSDLAKAVTQARLETEHQTLTEVDGMLQQMEAENKVLRDSQVHTAAEAAKNASQSAATISRLEAQLREVTSSVASDAQSRVQMADMDKGIKDIESKLVRLQTLDDRGDSAQIAASLRVQVRALAAHVTSMQKQIREQEAPVSVNPGTEYILKSKVSDLVSRTKVKLEGERAARLTAEQQLLQAEVKLRTLQLGATSPRESAAGTAAIRRLTEEVELLRTGSLTEREATITAQEQLQLAQAEILVLQSSGGAASPAAVAAGDTAALGQAKLAAEDRASAAMNYAAEADARIVQLEANNTELAAAYAKLQQSSDTRRKKPAAGDLSKEVAALQRELLVARSSSHAGSGSGEDVAALQKQVHDLKVKLASAKKDSESSVSFYGDKIAESETKVAEEAEARLAAEEVAQELREQLQTGMLVSPRADGDDSGDDSDDLRAQLDAAKVDLRRQKMKIKQHEAAIERQSEARTCSEELLVEREAHWASKYTVDGAINDAVRPRGLALDLTSAPLDLTNASGSLAGGVRAVQAKHLRELYDRTDVDGDENVSRAELIETVRRDPILQGMFNLPIGSKMREEDRLKLEQIFDEIDTDNSYGISYEEFSTYINERYSQLPSLAPGSYGLGDRVLSFGTDGSLSITAPSEKLDHKKLLLSETAAFVPLTPRPIGLDGHGRPKADSDEEVSAQDGSPTMNRSRSRRTPSPASMTRVVARPGRPSGNRRHRGGAFTFKSTGGQDIRTQQTAELVGAAEAGMQDIICGDFFRRRRRFRRSMQSRITRELRIAAKAPHRLDLPHYWKRPTVTEPYQQLLEPFNVLCNLPDGTVEEVACEATMSMLELLEIIYEKCEEEDIEMPHEGPEGLILKATSVYSYLDGNEKLIDYLYLRTIVKKGDTPAVTVYMRDEVIEKIRVDIDEVAPSDTKLADESDEDDNEIDFDLLERSFDPRADRATWSFIPLVELRRPLRVRVVGIDQLVCVDQKPDVWLRQTELHLPEKRGRRMSITGVRKASISNEAASTLPPELQDGDDHHKKKKVKEIDPALLGKEQMYVKAGLYYGGHLLHETCVYTSKKSRSNNPRFNESMTFDFDISRLPRSARLCFTAYRTYEFADELGVDPTPLGWVGMYLFDDSNRLRQGPIPQRLWPFAEANPIGTCEENLRRHSSQTGVLQLEFDTYSKTVLNPRHLQSVPGGGYTSSDVQRPTKWSMEDRARVKNILLADPLEQLSETDKKMLWNLRYLCITQPEALPKVLQSVDWTDSASVQEAHRLLDDWAPLSAKQALVLLDAHFPDERVRAYAVERLKSLCDEELGEYVLQLVQVLKYEQYHDSPLAVFLISRALACRNVVGHNMFWHMKAEMHVPEIAERYGFLLEMYLENCGAHLGDLSKQNTVMQMLCEAARAIKDPFVEKRDRLSVLRRRLSEMTFPETFGMPLNPELLCAGLKVEKCKFMDSKKRKCQQS